MNGKKKSTLILIMLALALAMVPGINAEDPIRNFKVVQGLPDKIVAGSTYEVVFTFNNIAHESVPFAINVTAACTEVGKPLDFDEIILEEVSLNDVPLTYAESSTKPGFFKSAGKWTLAPSSSNVLSVTLSSVVNLMPGTYTFEFTYGAASVIIPSLPTPTTNKPPVADAGSNRIAFVGKSIDFDGSGSSDSDGTITKYGWAFGDGASGTGASTSHAYSVKGAYTVTLTVTDDDGATDTASMTVKVEELPVSVKNETKTTINGTQTDFVIDDTSTIGVKVRLNTTGDVDVYLVEYATNPYPNATKPENMLPKYIDIFISDPDSVAWPIYVEVHYTDAEIAGLDESTLALYYYADGAWNLCSNTGVDTVNNFVWAYLTRTEAAGSPLSIGKMPAAPQFTLSSLSVAPAQVNVGDTVTVQVAVKNIGDLEGSTTVDLLVNGVKEQSKTVTLASGASTTVSFTVSKTVAGTYTVKIGSLTSSFTAVKPPTPASFTFTDLIVSPADVTPDTEVTASVTVKNTGEQSGTYSVELKLDGATKETKTGTLAGGASTTVSFKVSSQTEGTHTVQVGDLTGSFTVKATGISPGYIAVILIVIIAAGASVYALYRRGRLPLHNLLKRTT